MIVVALALASAIGLSLGILGSGGSIVTLPVLIYVAAMPAKEAVAMSMALVGATSLFGTVLHVRKGNVAWKPALIFAATGMIGAYLGSAGTHLIPKKILLLIFAAIMLLVGALMLRNYPIGSKPRACSIRRCLAVGFVVGILTGFLGVGGGFLIVPALVMSAGLETRLAGGTSLAVISLNSAVGLAGQLRYATVNWTLLAGFLLFTFAGMMAGISLAGRLNDRILRRLFAFCLIALALVLAILNI